MLVWVCLWRRPVTDAWSVFIYCKEQTRVTSCSQRCLLFISRNVLEECRNNSESSASTRRQQEQADFLLGTIILNIAKWLANCGWSNGAPTRIKSRGRKLHMVSWMDSWPATMKRTVCSEWCMQCQSRQEHYCSDTLLLHWWIIKFTL